MKASCNNGDFGAQLRGFCIRCLRFTNLIAKTHAKLASSDLLRPSGWNARFPVASIRSFQKVSPISSFYEHRVATIILLLRAFVSQSPFVLVFSRRQYYNNSMDEVSVIKIAGIGKLSMKFHTKTTKKERGGCCKQAELDSFTIFVFLRYTPSRSK